MMVWEREKLTGLEHARGRGGGDPQSPTERVDVKGKPSRFRCARSSGDAQMPLETFARRIADRSNPFRLWVASAHSR